MPSINYHDLLAGEATTEVVYNGHTVTLTYDPNASADPTVLVGMRNLAKKARTFGANTDALEETDDDEAAIDQATAMLDDVASAVNALLRRFLVAWDVTDDDGVTMFPLTDARLSDLPFEFRKTCLTALTNAGRVGEANGTVSPAPSPATSRTAMKRGSRR